MKYQLKGQHLPHLALELGSGESIRTQPGAMVYMAGNLKMETKMAGGLFAGAKRKMAGESAFMVTYEASETSVIGLAPTFPGTIMALELDGTTDILAERGSLLAADLSIDISIASHRKLKAGILGGEKLIYQRLRGTGLVFLAAAGDMIPFTLGPGQVIRADNGALLWYDSSVKYDVERIKGIKNIWRGGEGLYLVRLEGPGRVGLQSHMPKMKEEDMQKSSGKSTGMVRGLLGPR